MVKFFVALLILSPAFVLSGCGAFRWSGHHVHEDSSPHGHHNWADEPYFTPGTAGGHAHPLAVKNETSVQKNGHVFKFKTIPDYPRWDEKVILRLEIYDLARSTPVTGVPLTCKTTMSQHGPGMSGVVHNYKSHDFHLESSPGVYDMAILFGVGGVWTVHYKVSLPGKKLAVEFPVRVKRSGDLQQEWEEMQPKSPGGDQPKEGGPILPPGSYPAIGQ